MKIVCATIALVAAGVSGVLATQPPSRTLGDLVAETSIAPRPPMPAAVQSLPIGQSAWADATDAGGYAAAWWNVPNQRFELLHLFAIDRKSGVWHHRQVTPAPTETGTLSDLTLSPRFVAVEMHLNPSAAATLVYTRDLTTVGSFYGWIKTRLPNELMVFEQSQVHFAPTHYVEMSVYDPVSARTRQIYPPPEAGRIRREYIEVVQRRWAVLGENWFREHNHHGDAKLFDDLMQHDAVVVDWPRGLAFLVTYRDEPPPDVVGMDRIEIDVVVTCDGLTALATIACRETKASDWQQRFPGVDRDGLLARAAAQPRLVAWQ